MSHRIPDDRLASAISRHQPPAIQGNDNRTDSGTRLHGWTLLLSVLELPSTNFTILISSDDLTFTREGDCARITMRYDFDLFRILTTTVNCQLQGYLSLSGCRYAPIVITGKPQNTIGGGKEIKEVGKREEWTLVPLKKALYWHCILSGVSPTRCTHTTYAPNFSFLQYHPSVTSARRLKDRQHRRSSGPPRHVVTAPTGQKPLSRDSSVPRTACIVRNW